MKRKHKKRLMTAGRVFILGIYLLFALAPFYWLLITSLKDRKAILTKEIQYWPKQITLENYLVLFESSDFHIFLKNSVLVSSVTGVIVTGLAILGGYAMARYSFRGKNVTVYGLLLTQMIPGVLLLVPMVVLFSKMGLMNTLAGLTLFYVVTNLPFCLLLMRSFFERMPQDLEEAALVDGCGKIRSIVRIVLPLMLPGIFATFVFAFIGAWNELLAAVMFLSSDALKTIPVGLSMFVQNYEVDWGVMTAGGVVALIPSLILFAVVQKYVVAGLTDGAVKG